MMVQCAFVLMTQMKIIMLPWIRAMEVQIDAAYLDFRKAFDTVPHKRLLNKLKGYSVSGPILKWIESFLTDRITNFI